MTDPIIKFDAVRKAYGDVTILNNLDFNVARGEKVTIIGPSGSGKSTLIRHLNRLIEPTSGEIIVKGQTLSQLNGAALRDMRARNIGMVFQSVALLPNRTVLGNTALGLEVRGVARAERASRQLGHGHARLAGTGGGSG